MQNKNSVFLSQENQQIISNKLIDEPVNIYQLPAADQSQPKLNDEITINACKLMCEQTIKQYRPELENHCGWKQILSNLTLAIAGLVVGYLAFRCYKYFYKKENFFL